MANHLRLVTEQAEPGKCPNCGDAWGEITQGGKVVFRACLTCGTLPEDAPRNQTIEAECKQYERAIVDLFTVDDRFMREIISGDIRALMRDRARQARQFFRYALAAARDA